MIRPLNGAFRAVHAGAPGATQAASAATDNWG